MARRTEISPAEARRIALAAQGFATARPERATGRHLPRVLARTGLLQIDSVNVLVRAHYLPAFSRLGPYPADALDRLSHRAPRRLFEYWGHEASLLPVELHPLLRWRMERAADEAWAGVRRVAAERPGLVERLYEAVRDRGPVTASALSDGAPRARREMWAWSDAKRALEWLFWSGRISSARRLANFERAYDLPERVLPAVVLAAPTPDPGEARRELVRRAGRSLGIATAADLRDYFRLGAAETAVAIDELVEAGELVPVAVEGWRATGYLDPAARVPRRVDARALVGPFDPLVWSRGRTERLFGFRYRLEIYTPAHRRVHGYYVLPFVLGDRFVGRVDLKADRAAGALAVRSLHLETGAPVGTAEALAAELDALARWLGLEPAAIATGDQPSSRSTRRTP